MIRQSGGRMKKLTTTKATHRGVEITVMSDRVSGTIMYCCSNGRSTGVVEEMWFSTQGEAIANERHVIDRILRQLPSSTNGFHPPGGESE